MFKKTKWGLVIAGLCAGIINGLFSSGGGMVLIPLMTMLTAMQEDEIFPNSVAIILPVCTVSLVLLLHNASFKITDVAPYLAGSFFGGLLAWKFGKRIPTKWLLAARFSGG